MPEPTTTCPRCDAPLNPDDVAGGLCPRCLFAGALAETPPPPATPADPVPTPEDLAPRFPAYEVQALIGRGAMGAVYRARHSKLDRLVAIKVLLPKLTHDPAFAERFMREARALARLDHPGIVRVHDFGEAGGVFFLIMEYVDGLSLRELLRQGQLSARDVLAFIPQLCDALQYAHDLRVVHRDIKPENILVDQDGRVRIADFGLAKIVGNEQASAGLTGTEQVFGTPHYMSPEQMRASGSVDHRADIYSLGVVLYEMLTGSLPLGRFAPPSQKSAAGKTFDDVVLKSLASEPDERYQQAKEVKADLGRAAGEGSAEPAGAPGAAAAMPAAPPRARSSPITPALSSRLSIGHCIALAIVLAASFMSWAEVRSDSFAGAGFGPVTMDMTAWNSNMNGIPTWLAVAAFAAAVGLVIARSFGQPARRPLVLGAAAVVVVFSGVFVVVMVMHEDADVEVGSVLTLACAVWLTVVEIRDALRQPARPVAAKVRPAIDAEDQTPAGVAGYRPRRRPR